MYVNVKRILQLGLLVYLGFGALIFFSHRSLIYYPNLIQSDFYHCPAFDDSQKINANGTRAYYKHTSDRIVVVYNGNAGSACDRSYLKDIFGENKYSYLFVEYAGYGGDDQKPSRELLFNDAENIVSFLKAKNYTETLLVAESIGSGVASYHATLTPIDRMLFVAPFDSLLNVAKSKFPFYPMFLLEFVSDENYDNLALLEGYKGELRIIHGATDRVVPLKRGKALFDNTTASNKEFIVIDEAGHNDIYEFENTWKSISEFLRIDSQ